MKRAALVLFAVLCVPLAASADPFQTYPDSTFSEPPPAQDEPQARKEFDYLLPGWNVKVAQIEPDLFRFDLRMRIVSTGGDGEARQVFQRGARDLVESGGYAGYEIVRYEEGVDSGLFFARRTASGLVRVKQSLTWGM